MSLADEMRTAADILDKVNKHHGLTSTVWGPHRLRSLANQLDADNSEAVDELTEDLLDAMRNDQWRLPEGPMLVRDWCQAHAHTLITKGWHKGGNP